MVKISPKLDFYYPQSPSSIKLLVIFKNPTITLYLFAELHNHRLALTEPLGEVNQSMIRKAREINSAN